MQRGSPSISLSPCRILPTVVSSAPTVRARSSDSRSSHQPPRAGAQIVMRQAQTIAARQVVKPVIVGQAGFKGSARLLEEPIAIVKQAQLKLRLRIGRLVRHRILTETQRPREFAHLAIGQAEPQHRPRIARFQREDTVVQVDCVLILIPRQIQARKLKVNRQVCRPQFQRPLQVIQALHRKSRPTEARRRSSESPRRHRH